MPYRAISHLLAGAAIFIASHTAAATERQPIGSPVSIQMTSGETLTGTLISRSDDIIMLEHPVLGRLAIPAASVVTLTAAAAEPGAAEAGAPAPPADVAAPAEAAPPARPWFWEGWNGKFDFGLFGSEGNTRRLNLRTGLELRRETEETLTTFDARYYYATDRSQRTDNKARIDLRNDWLPSEGSRWRPFVLGTFEYDEFKEWDIRLGLFGGLGYEFIKTERTTLIGRLGAGISREFGGDDSSIRPEGLIGADLEHQINDRQRITASIDFFPDLKDFGEFRFNAKAQWEVLLDVESQITLKVGVEDRYDSTPGDARRNDVDYFAVIAIPF